MSRRPGERTDGPRETSTDVACPFCGSTDTRLERERGSALCRTTFYCEACNEPFEQFG